MAQNKSKSPENINKYDDYKKRMTFEAQSDRREHERESRKDKRRRSNSRSRSPKNDYNSSNVTKVTEEDDEESRTIFVWQLSKRIHQNDLRDFFSKAGAIKDIRLIKDQRTNRPKGIAYVEFTKAESVVRALALTGSRLLGVPIQINQVIDKPDMSDGAAGLLDNDYADRGGVGLGNTGRLALMAKLAEGTGLEMPKPAMEMMKSSLGSSSHNYAVSDIVNMKRQSNFATECFVLSNMFDNPMKTAIDPDFYQELKEDVLEECNRYGKVLHLFIDKRGTEGNVYVKCCNVEDATKCVNVMHGRFFSGRVITANHITASTYHQLSTAASMGSK